MKLKNLTPEERGWLVLALRELEVDVKDIARLLRVCSQRVSRLQKDALRRIGNSADGWDRAISLKDGKAMTRDGRIVFHLRESVIDDGETILTGDVSTKPRRRYKTDDIIFTEKHYWRGRGAWGNHGGDDLMTLNIDPTPKY